MTNFSNDTYEYILAVEEDTKAIKVAVDYDGKTKLMLTMIH